MGKWVKKQRDKLFCPNCGKLVNYRIEERKEIYDIRGDQIEILAKVAKCIDCGEELVEPYLEDQNFLEAYKIYAKKHGLVTPEEIRRIREKYGLSQALFARILGIGRATIERYEAGALPTESISNLIKSADDPKVFLELLEKNKENLSQSDYQRIKTKIEEFSKTDFLYDLETLFKKLTGNFNIVFSKIYGAVAAILRFHNKPYITKTRLMKFLWFVDSEYYNLYAKSLTNLAYAHLPNGPAPHCHDILLGLLEESGTVKVEIEIKDDDSEMIKIFLKDESMIKYLEAEELEVIRKVMDKYGKLSTNELISLSHQDERWKKTRDGEPIEL